MAKKIRNHTYTNKELQEAIEYMKNDIAYLESRLPAYENNSYVFEKVEENIEYSKNLLKEFEANL